MNKRMKEIQASIVQKMSAVKEFQNKKEYKNAKEVLAEIDQLKDEYEVEAALYEDEKGSVPNTGVKAENKISGFSVFSKVLAKKKLTDEEMKAITLPENALLVDGENGENYLIPEDISTKINEFRKTYISAKELVTVIPTTATTGAETYEESTPVGLIGFEDGDDVPTETEPKFVHKTWKIKQKGKIMPISRFLLSAETAGIMAYLNKWFIKNAIISENQDIFDKLKEGKTAKTIKGLEGLKESINKELDPSALIGGVIVTNQTGFNGMDKETDAVGRPLLNIDLKNPTSKIFNGLPIVVFPDTQLSNGTGGKAPIFYGNLKSAITFMEKQGIEFAMSEHVFFTKNQNALRVIEAYDVVQADGDAYCYSLFEAVSEKTITTKAGA